MPIGVSVWRIEAGTAVAVAPTPLANEEFRSTTDHVFAAYAGTPAVGHMDLLTVLLHELGHVAGLPDVSANDAGLVLMAESLAPGIRRLP